MRFCVQPKQNVQPFLFSQSTAVSGSAAACGGRACGVNASQEEDLPTTQRSVFIDRALKCYLNK